jgi:hypothetical protein
MVISILNTQMSVQNLKTKKAIDKRPDYIDETGLRKKLAFMYKIWAFVIKIWLLVYCFLSHYYFKVLLKHE